MSEVDFPSHAEIKEALRKEREAAYMRQYRARMTAEQKAHVNTHHSEYMRRKRAERTPEEREQYNAYMRQYKAKKKAEKLQSFEI